MREDRIFKLCACGWFRHLLVSRSLHRVRPGRVAMTLSHRGRAVVGTGLPTRPPVPSRQPIRGVPSEPARAYVRRVLHPLLGGKPSRLSLPWHHHRCAPRLWCPCRAPLPPVVGALCAPPARKRTARHPFLFPTAEWALCPGTFA